MVRLISATGNRRPWSVPAARAHSAFRSLQTWLIRALRVARLGGLPLGKIVGETWKRINDQAIMTRAAAITFYGVAALVPFMGLLMTFSAQALPWLDAGSPGASSFSPSTRSTHLAGRRGLTSAT